VPKRTFNWGPIEIRPMSEDDSFGAIDAKDDWYVERTFQLTIPSQWDLVWSKLGRVHNRPKCQRMTSRKPGTMDSDTRSRASTLRRAPRPTK
jgi:hypothetical protein